jgi:hypothetical protein
MVSGLLGLTAGCDDQDTVREESDPDTETHEHDSEGAMCSLATAENGKLDAGAGDGDGAGHMATEEVEKEISTEDVQHTFSELTGMCDARNGYVQINGSCSGVNTCQGFFYGNWEEDSQLVEHTCAGVNGCAGLSCLIPGREGDEAGMSAEEILKLDDDWFLERTGAYGPKACKNCHIDSEYSEELQDYVYDYTKLKIPVFASSGRNLSNWRERPAKYQESLVAFGARGITEDGVPYSNMASYAKLFSKEEIQRVVKYMRDFEPSRITFKDIVLKPGKRE